MWVSGALGALGVVWGIATRSQMVLLDGAYAVVGIVLSWLLLRASSDRLHQLLEPVPYDIWLTLELRPRSVEGP